MVCSVLLLLPSLPRAPANHVLAASGTPVPGVIAAHAFGKPVLVPGAGMVFGMRLHVETCQPCLVGFSARGSVLVRPCAPLGAAVCDPPWFPSISPEVCNLLAEQGGSHLGAAQALGRFP